VAVCLRANDLLLNSRQQQLRFGQRQTQIGDLTKTTRPADRQYPTGRIALFMIPQSMDGPTKAAEACTEIEEEPPKSALLHSVWVFLNLCGCFGGQADRGGSLVLTAMLVR
jgi:hypothetical protein